jgi:hypothetical protein
MSDLRHAIAVHEGGHAIVMKALGVQAVKLWIDEGGGASPSDSQDVLRLDLVDQIAIGRAGQQAINWLGVDAPVDLAREDRAMNAALVTRHSPDEQERLLREGKERALSLITRHADALKAVARDLEAAGSVDAPTLEAIWAKFS